MKKILCIFIVLLILLCGCSCDKPSDQSDAYVSSSDSVFVKNENGNLVNDSGVEYEHLANEGILYFFGDLEFVGSVQGEENTSQHEGILYQTGMFAIKDADNDNILIRHAPNNEWFAIYRKTSLQEFDFSVDNCIRLEFVSRIGYSNKDAIHITCGEGITDRSEISAFLSEIRVQKSPREAGLYDLVEKPDGMLENCYVCGVIYGFFEEEPHLAVQMTVTSYNDLAYSISIEGKEYVLPEDWLQKLKKQ